MPGMMNRRKRRLPLPDITVENAKHRLRCLGLPVFNAEIVFDKDKYPNGDTSIIVVGTQRFSRQQVIDIAKSSNPLRALRAMTTAQQAGKP
jgi:hypothetical protein